LPRNAIPVGKLLRAKFWIWSESGVSGSWLKLISLTSWPITGAGSVAFGSTTSAPIHCRLALASALSAPRKVLPGPVGSKSIWPNSGRVGAGGNSLRLAGTKPPPWTAIPSTVSGAELRPRKLLPLHTMRQLRPALFAITWLKLGGG
jgi:hypothetical protein